MKEQYSKQLLKFVNHGYQTSSPFFKDLEEIELFDAAFEQALADYKYHNTELQAEDAFNDILRNGGLLPVFLYRLGRLMHSKGYDDSIKYQNHFLLKRYCGVEIYWSTVIGEGFHIDHGVGTVIGSRSKIGKGFWIHQGCTIGHSSLDDIGVGPELGDNVVLYANSQILGEVKIGNNVKIGANSLVLNDVDSNQVVVGNPAKSLERASR